MRRARTGKHSPNTSGSVFEMPCADWDDDQGQEVSKLYLTGGYKKRVLKYGENISLSVMTVGVPVVVTAVLTVTVTATVTVTVTATLTVTVTASLLRGGGEAWSPPSPPLPSHCRAQI